MLAFDHLSRRMERQQSALLSALASWPTEHLKFRPFADAWSATQVIDHLQKNERGTADCLRASLANPGAPITPADAQRAYKLIRWLLSTEQAQVPRSQAGGVWPDDEPKLPETVEQWRHARRDLLELIRDKKPDDRTVFIHPGSGPMNLILVLRYLHAHTRHHEHQLARLQQAARAHDAGTLRT
jgi:hypothetical protein